VKLKYARIENFKGVKHLEIDFMSELYVRPRQPPIPRPLTCLIGDNGSGKTTVLQAIALTLSLATLRTRHYVDFNWLGFLAERVSSLGPTRVELIVILDDEEIELTPRLYQEWYHSLPNNWPRFQRLTHPPTEHKEVTLIYEPGALSSPQGDGAINQLLGRFCAQSLGRTQPDKTKLVPKLGDVFWYDQNRSIGSILMPTDDADRTPPVSAQTWQSGVEQLHDSLIGWWAYHTSAAKWNGRDYLIELEKHFAALFPGTRFLGVKPHDAVIPPRGVKDFYFLLERDGKVYDLAEMSSGEQAVFPLLYEFVRLDIAKSIVLIDELELHLHPREQQGLLSALRRLGPDCQFLITTHSQFLTHVIPEEEAVRLEGGLRCL
jgi:hypothetical protein